MSNQEVFDSLRSRTCFCGKTKRKLVPFCHFCYRRLPRQKRELLFTRKVSILAETISDCRKLLGSALERTIANYD